jgi:hypothetical protein
MFKINPGSPYHKHTFALFYGGSFKPSIARDKEGDSLKREFTQTTQNRWFFSFVLDW